MNALEAVFPFTARPGTPDDVGYVLDTFEEALWPEYRGTTRRGDFSRAIRAAVMDSIVTGATLLIASPEADPTVIWGWTLTAGDVVVFAYVREKSRQARICTRLLQAAGIDTTEEIKVRHLTKSTVDIRRSGKMKLRRIPVLG